MAQARLEEAAGPAQGAVTREETWWFKNNKATHLGPQFPGASWRQILREPLQLLPARVQPDR